jgi:hypothetical protein
MTDYAAQHLPALPKLDWKVGDPVEEWPHGFVGVPARAGQRCGVEISEGHLCWRFKDHPIHLIALEVAR